MSAAENLNNAIVRLEWLTPAEPEGRKRAVQELADHWLDYWQRDRSAHALADSEKLRAYARWYARAWAMVDRATRDKLPNPRTLSPSWRDLVMDELATVQEGAQATSRAGGDVAAYLEKQARAAAELLEKARNETLLTVAVLGAVAVAVFLAFSKAKH